MEANGIGHIVGIKIDTLLAPVRKYTRTGKTCLVWTKIITRNTVQHWLSHADSIPSSIPPPFYKKVILKYDNQLLMNIHMISLAD